MGGAATRGGNVADTSRPQVGNAAESYDASGHVADTSRTRPEDASSATSCHLCVTYADLACLTELWPKLPESTRAAILTLAVGARHG